MSSIKHLADITSLENSTIENIFSMASDYLNGAKDFSTTLKNKLIVNLFFENSTRTQSSFEIASKRCGAEVVNFDISKSSTMKGETLYDTALNINAMSPDAVVVRHSKSGMPKILSKYLECPIINGGDGAYSHPSQALLDFYTIKKYFSDPKKAKVGILGDIKNSRVASSNIAILAKYGIDPILISPPHFSKCTHLEHTYHLQGALDKINVLIVLRTQIERHSDKLYASLQDYATNYCVTRELIENKDILILHPGPVNRNIDISDAVLADKRCKVLEQVKHGVAIRIGILNHFIHQR